MPADARRRPIRTKVLPGKRAPENPASQTYAFDWIEFIDENGGGPGVRLRKGARKNK
jgi:hypothetical protein